MQLDGATDLAPHAIQTAKREVGLHGPVIGADRTGQKPLCLSEIAIEYG